MKFQVLSTIAATLVVGSQAQDIDTELHPCLQKLGELQNTGTYKPPLCVADLQKESESATAPILTKQYTCAGDNGEWKSGLKTYFQDPYFEKVSSCYSTIAKDVSECKDYNPATATVGKLACLAAIECTEECDAAVAEILESDSTSGAVPVGMSTVATAAVMAAAATQLF